MGFHSPVQTDFTWKPSDEPEVILAGCMYGHTNWDECTCGIYSTQQENFLREYGYSEDSSACFLLQTRGRCQVATAGDEYPCAYTVRSVGVILVGVVLEDDHKMNAGLAAAALYNFPVFPMGMVKDLIRESYLTHRELGWDPYDLETWRRFNYG